MKSSNKGFVVLLLITIIALLVIGGIYVYETNKTQSNTPATQQSINILSPENGASIHIGQITEIMWQHYEPQNGDNAVFDITEISSDGQSIIVSVTPEQVGCNGHQAAACGYAWVPTQAHQQDKISVSERGANRVGYSGPFSVVLPAIVKPSITSIDPKQGATNTVVTIFGSNLSGAKAVEFSLDGQSVASNIASDIYSNDQNHLTFNTSSIHTPSGTYQVSVLTVAGYSNSVGFTIK